MDPFHDKAGNDQRASLRMSASASLTADDDDDYTLAAMGISDGFRPADLSAAHQPTTSTIIPSTGSTIVSRDSPVPRRATSARPSSIAKPPHSHDPLALRHDGSASQPSGAPISRISSTSTDSPIIRSESPYEGPSGPSHPYQMYPQRTNSVATSTTARMSERSYAGPRGPTHPYTLYTQNTVPVDTAESDDIPVGFAGRSDGYHRRIGPEGEEIADLIGPLGHTEELPPYTRYPEQAYARKQPGASQLTPGQQSHHDQQRQGQPSPSSPSSPQQQSQQPAVAVTTATVAAIPGAGGLGLATRNPEFESREDLRLQPSRMSSRTLASDTASQHEINTAAEVYAEKGEVQSDRKWQKRAKKRLFGVIPYWAICLLAVGLVMMGIILGAVIGTFSAKHKNPPGKHQDDEPIPLVIPTATADIKPLATLPPDLPAMEVGTFGLPPLIASQAPSTCFNDTTQSQAWTCNIPFTTYVMGVSRIANELPISDYTLKLTTFNDSDHNENSPFNMFSWGTQPPLIMDPLKMRLVNDTSEPGRGAAWFAQMTYNKTVIVAEDRFPGVSTPKKQQPQSKRGWGGSSSQMGEFSRKSVKGAQAGDRPWICTWPGTLLEVFVYPAQNNSYRKPTSTMGPSAAAAFPSSTSTQFLVRYGLQTEAPRPSSMPSDRPHRAPPPPYPQVIKFEERRVSLDQTKNAVCQQVEVCDDGEKTVPVLTDEGQPVEIFIMENRQTVAIADSTKRWIHEDSLLVSPRDQPVRTSQLSDCGCIWWFT
ncbi:hypothetical protein CTA2_8374 [Colletotrichum tanaceti]|uniref:DUF7820 domain-containing protein n=1 Tax=Colletotrichum tanaceti TaxID=1306861 RepID=A0A4U6XRK5_9PEZI|nr:hypothetical protein CTA2_8374 [Colletotrichum tanaceti]TKW58497.1 hypothetical protein CTA1_3871 [Colletotrichum tanaceti]